MSGIILFVHEESALEHQVPVPDEISVNVFHVYISVGNLLPLSEFKERQDTPKVKESATRTSTWMGSGGWGFVNQTSTAVRKSPFLSSSQHS